MDDVLTRVILASDDTATLAMLHDMVEDSGAFHIVASCSSSGACLDAMRRFSPEIAILHFATSARSWWQVLVVAAAEKLPTRINLVASHIQPANDHKLQVRSKSEPMRPASASNLVIDGIGEASALLTSREREITRLVARGLSNKSIARRLMLSDGTVRIHLHNIFQKLGVANRTELAVRSFAALASAASD
jgi:two-component system, NarL family, nitrate/nitrite response regulator NarL